jgi:AcrR family transcriptional regulator
LKQAFEMSIPSCQNPPVISTRDRLLAAAEAVFGQLGYREATIQKIAEMAEANIAAVNYHFGDKARLCAAVIERELERRSAGASMPTLGDQPEQPELQLERFVRWFVRRMVACGPGGVMVKLSQEMAAMGEVLDQLMELHIRRVHTALSEIVAALLPAGTSADVLRRTSISILGLCVTYRHAQPIHARVYPELDLDGDELERIAAHSAAFSVAGVAAVRRGLVRSALGGASAAHAATGVEETAGQLTTAQKTTARKTAGQKTASQGNTGRAGQGFTQLGLVAERAPRAYGAALDADGARSGGPSLKGADLQGVDSEEVDLSSTDHVRAADRGTPRSPVTAADPAPASAGGDFSAKSGKPTPKGRSRKAALQPPQAGPRGAAGPKPSAKAAGRPALPGPGSKPSSKPKSNSKGSSTSRSKTTRRRGPTSP